MNYLTWSGIAVVSGGVLMILVNVVFSPLLPIGGSGPEMMASTVFFWRLSLAALTAFLLLVGSPGLFLHQSGRSGRLGVIAFVLAFIGSGLLFAHEWAQVFFLHPLAIVAPDALQAMEDVEGLNLYDIEAMLAAGIFAIGWIAFSASMLFGGVFPRLGPALVIAGFFAVPILTVAVSSIWGPVIGTAVLGSGWILLGRELIKGPQGS